MVMSECRADRRPVPRLVPRALAVAFVAWMAALLVASDAAAQPYGSPYYGQPYYGQPYYRLPSGQSYGQPPGQSQTARPQTETPQFRPVPPTNAQGIPPTYQPAPARMPSQMPYGYPGYQPNWPSNYPQGPVQPAQGEQPRLKWSLAVADPYLQQPVVLNLDVISSENLSTANLELPASGDVLMKTLRGPNTTTRSGKGGGRREIVNGFVLTVVPLRAGSLELPPIKVTGNWSAGGMEQRYEARTERTIRLQVRPSMTSVRPWLPLKSLSLKSSLDREGVLEPGQPVTLTLEIAGDGATAVELPSLENQLSGPGFRVYREQTLTNTELSSDGRELLATRTEYYTLVPQAGGRFSLPEMSIAWWNVDQGVREVARLPLKTLAVRGGGPFGFSASALASSGWVKIWIPLAGVLLLVAGYWVGVLYRGRPFQAGGALLALAGQGLRLGYRALVTRAGPYLAGLKPAALLASAHRHLWRAMPASSHFLRCVRHANRAASPDAWCALFEEEARACMPFKGEFTQPWLTHQILTLRPGADRATLDRLMGQLDAALYGGRTIDFPRWKRELMGQVRRGAGVIRAREAGDRVRWAALPTLNPS